MDRLLPTNALVPAGEVACRFLARSDQFLERKKNAKNDPFTCGKYQRRHVSMCFIQVIRIKCRLLSALIWSRTAVDKSLLASFLASLLASLLALRLVTAIDADIPPECRKFAQCTSERSERNSRDVKNGKSTEESARF